MGQEKKGEEKIESLDVDISDIKDMQQTQIMKKIEEEKMKVELQEAKELKKEQKTHPIYVSILIIILMADFFGMGFFVGLYYYKNAINNCDKIEKTETSVSTIVEISEQEVMNQLDYYDYVVSYFNRFYSDDYPLKVTGLTNQDVLQSGLYFLEEKDSNGYPQYPKSFSREELREAIQKIYGADFTYKNENIMCFNGDGVFYTLNGSKYEYSDTHGHDGRSYARFHTYFIKAIKNEKLGTIQVQTKVLYGNPCGGTCGPVTDYYKEGKGETTPIYSVVSSNNSSVEFDVIYEQHKDELPITTFIFKKDSNGKYGLKSIAIN